jgi:hypothetical protein
MPYMTRIPSDLAKFGLKVETVAGWQTRGSSSFAPAGVVCHWTAGPKGTTKRPSLNIVINGRPDLSGPLCNVYLDRAGICVVVAAGRANHAGAGSWNGLKGNSSVYGIEAEAANNGDWTPAQRDAYPRLCAALMYGLGRDSANVCGHSEWAGPRKTDINGYTPAALRLQAAAIIGAAGKKTTTAQATALTQEDDLTPEQAKMLTEVHHELTQRIKSRVPGSTYTDTMLGYAANADASSYQANQALKAQAAEIEALQAQIAKLTNSGTAAAAKTPAK